MPLQIPSKPPNLRYGQSVFLANGEELTVLHYMPATRQVMARRANGVRTYFDAATKTYDTKEEATFGEG